MGWIRNLLQTRARAASSPRIEGSQGYFPGRVTAGVHVNEDVALTYSAVWSAVRVISETIGCLSWHEFAKRKTGGRDLQVGSPVDFMIHDQANSEMTSNTFREVLMSHVLLWGNGYAEIERDRAGRPVAMWPLPPDRTRPVRTELGEIVYEYQQPDGTTIGIPSLNMFHLRGLGFDGLVGYSVIQMARESIGMGLAAEKFGSAFYGNDSRPGGIIKHPAKLKDDQRDGIRKEFERIHGGGPANSWRVAVFEMGMDFQPVGIPQNDAQYIETRKFQVTEVARWFRVPPHKLADLERATFSNIEQQSIEFVTEAILPWVCKLESEANWKLFGRNNRGKRFSKMKIDSLLRGDQKSRFDAYAVGRNWGWLSADDIRELEDMNPLPRDQNGDTYLIPANMTPAEKALDEPEPVVQMMPAAEPEEDQDAGDDQDDDNVPVRSLNEFKATYRRLFTDLLVRCFGREKARMGGDSEKLRLFWDEHRQYMMRALRPAAQAVGDLVGVGAASVRSQSIEDVLVTFVNGYCDISFRTVLDAKRCNDLDGLIELWEMEKPDATAEDLVDLLVGACRKGRTS